MNKTKSNQISLTSLEKEQIRTAIKNLTNILNKYEVKEANMVSQTAFNKAFNKILDGSTQRYLNTNRNTDEVSKKKPSRIEVLDSNGNWLLDYSTDPENSYFWYQFDRVYTILQNQFSLQFEEMQPLMKSLVETQYKMKDVTPDIVFFGNHRNG